MKIAIVRGINLNRFEMQSYEPLSSTHEIIGYASYNDPFELDNIRFNIKRLHSVEEYYNFLPSPVKGLIYGILLPYGMNNRLIGLEKELKDKDIIHGLETYNGFCYQAARVRKEKKKKLVLTIWENIPFQSTRQFKACNGLPGLLKKTCLKVTDNNRIVQFIKDNTDVFIAVTERAAKALVIEGIPEEKIRIISPGIDVDRFKPRKVDQLMRKRLGVSENEFIFLFVGRLTIEKGIYDLLYAIKLLSAEKDFSNVKFVIVGNGPERENIIRMIKTLDIETHVKMAGMFSYQDMPKLYNSADAFILPSIPLSWWQEQFGMVLVEAMASGLPVISTLSGSIPEVVGENGILIQPNDPLSIYNEVKRLATDESARNKYSRLGRERALQMFDANIVSKQIEAVYKELM